MPSIVSPGTPRTDVGVSSEDIDELSFALVAPLGAEDNGGSHGGRAEVVERRGEAVGREVSIVTVN